MEKQDISFIMIGILLIMAFVIAGCSSTKNANPNVPDVQKKEIEKTDTEKTDTDNTDEPENESAGDTESLYQSTLEEVKKINDNSNMLGAVLLSKPDKKIPNEVPIPLPLDQEGNKGSYAKSRYHKTSVVTQIILESPETNVLGIAVGDDKKVIEEKLKGTAYRLSDPTPNYQIVYQAYHVSLSFKLSEDDKIVSILVYVYDPTEDIPTY